MMNQTERINFDCGCVMEVVETEYGRVAVVKQCKKHKNPFEKLKSLIP